MKRFREWKRGWRIATRVVGVVLVAVPTYLLRDVIQANWIHNSVYETAKREGAIVTAADLRAMTAVKEPENAAPIILEEMEKWQKSKELSLHKALDLLKPLDFTKPAIAPNPPTEAELAQARQVLAKATQDLKPLEAVLSKPHCDFKHEWEKGPALIFPEHEFVRGAVRIMAIQAAEHVRQGKDDHAIRLYRLGLHLGRLIGETPVLISALLQVKCNAIIRESIAHSLTAYKAASLPIQVRTLLEETVSPIDPRRPMAGELYFNWDMAQRVVELSDYNSDDTSREYDGTSRFIHRVTMIPGVQRSWRTRSLQWCIATNRKFKLSHGDPVRASALVTSHPDYDDEGGLSNYLNGILQPIFGQSQQAFVRDVAGHETLLAALDVLDARQKLGRWPDALPVSRRDPFGARSLRYRSDGKGVRIWSIGPDFKDSNGVTKSEDLDSDDVVIRL